MSYLFSQALVELRGESLMGDRLMANNKYTLGGQANTLNEIASLYGKSWPGWVGGYQQWSLGRHPLCNHFAFYSDVEELKKATMLEF